jgi:hypothetical protein
MEQPKIKRIDNEEELRKQVEKCRIVITIAMTTIALGKTVGKGRLDEELPKPTVEKKG